MNQEERDWLHWLKQVREGAITQRQAAEWMQVTERWVRELLRRQEQVGDAVVIHGLRGRASNRRIAEAVRAEAVRLLRQPDWRDFGPTEVDPVFWTVPLGGSAAWKMERSNARNTQNSSAEPEGEGRRGGNPRGQDDRGDRQAV